MCISDRAKAASRSAKRRLFRSASSLYSNEIKALKPRKSVESKRIWEVMAARASSPDTPANELVRRCAFFLITMLACLSGIPISILYISLDECLAAVFPATYCILVAGTLLVFNTWKGHYHEIVIVQLLLILLMPMAVQMSMGGMVRSGGAMMWSFLCPLGAALFCKNSVAMRWFALYTTLSAGILIHEFRIGSLDMMEIMHFVMNICGSMAIVFCGVIFFHNELDAEYARSQDLLLNILPATIVSRLKKGESQIVNQIDGATIIFADLVGFTQASAKMSPKFLIGVFLRDVFSAWDELCQWRHIEKIKTIGDAYMAMSGPAGKAEMDGDRNHAEDIVLLAFEFQDALAEINEKYNQSFQLRVGVHSGPIIAGVIGLKKFSFGKSYYKKLPCFVVHMAAVTLIAGGTYHIYSCCFFLQYS